MSQKKIVAVFFGSRSVEHDVSIVTAHQVMRAFDPRRYEVVPVYITRDGRWMTGSGLMEIKNFQMDVTDIATIRETHFSPSTAFPGLITPPISGLFGKSKFQRIDVAFSTIHGTHGEDGTIQGLFELADVPYVGTGVLASAVANNKIIAKALLREYGIPVVEGVGFSRREWLSDPGAVMERVDELGYPAFVKPATLGSSIGVARVDDPERARLYIDIAANFARDVIVERAVVGGIEINCAVLGNHSIQTSVLEQPISSEQFLTYEEKYLRGEGGKAAGMKGADRVIPAPISADLTAKIQEIARHAFMAIDGRGTARLDFLVKPETDDVWLNEINTMPGSLAFYLWEASGKSPSQLVDELVELALESHAEKRQTTFDYKSKLISHAAARGVAGVKGMKK